MADNSKYLNGFFATKKEGAYGEYISVGITEEGIEALKNLPKNGNFRNFTLTPQKNDPNKYSAKPFVDKKSDNGSDNLPFWWNNLHILTGSLS